MEMGTATASKKRKICHDAGDHQEEDDEQKMEKFYDLIKNLCEAREILMMNGSKRLNWNAENKLIRKQKKIIKEDQRKFAAAWKPSFKLEDFMIKEAAVDPPAVTTSLVGNSAQREEGNHEEGLELDLRLSL